MILHFSTKFHAFYIKNILKLPNGAQMFRSNLSILKCSIVPMHMRDLIASCSATRDEQKLQLKCLLQ